MYSTYFLKSDILKLQIESQLENSIDYGDSEYEVSLCSI